MQKYRRSLTTIAALSALATLLSGCIVVPRGHYRYYRHADATPVVAPASAVAQAPAHTHAG